MGVVNVYNPLLVSSPVLVGLMVESLSLGLDFIEELCPLLNASACLRSNPTYVLYFARLGGFNFV